MPELQRSGTKRSGSGAGREAVGEDQTFNGILGAIRQYNTSPSPDSSVCISNTVTYRKRRSLKSLMSTRLGLHSTHVSLMTNEFKTLNIASV